LILVDTSVWIDFLNGISSKHQLMLHQLIQEDEDICLANIVLMEILQGIRNDKDFKQVKGYLLEFPIYSLQNVNSYIATAQIYRSCRKKGLTIRRPLDCLIARVAIENDLILLHNDKDFEVIASTIGELKIFKL